jgi:hypothetical protein
MPNAVPAKWQQTVAVNDALNKYWGGGQILWVGNRSGLPSGDGSNPTYPLSTIGGAGGALAKLQGSTNRGHVIFVLPGHAENVSSADYFSHTSPANSFALVGLGKGTSRPSLTWTTATSTWLWDTANIQLDNFRLLMAGPSGTTALSVAAPITVSAAGCGLRNNYVQFGIDADQLATIGITTTAAATGLTLENNRCIGATAAEVTTFLQIVGVDDLVMKDNLFQGATSAVGVGIVRFATTPSLYVTLENNTYINKKALSTCAVTGLAGVSGVSRNEHFAYLDTSSLTAWLTSTGLMTFHRPTVTNTAGETGTEVVGTVSA